AVKVKGQYYWDGGFMGNPPLFPFFYNSPSDDILIVQINPIVRPGEPRSAADIQNRMNEITFNSPLLHELRAIDFVTRLLDSGRLNEDEYRRMRVHLIHDRKRLRPLDASSKSNSEWAFLKHLFEIGRDAATRWLGRNYDRIGVDSTVDIRSMFDGFGALPDGLDPLTRSARAKRPGRSRKVGS
ncbi:MAG: patatin-like phospholipase family protein, partial [Pseudomonadota bacterium]